MTSQSVRENILIKILPEILNMPVYQSGKCHAVLQVKENKNGPNYTGLHIHETNVSRKNEVRRDCEEKESQEKAYEIELLVDTINENSSCDFEEDAISHYIFGNFKNKKLPIADSEDLAFTPQIVPRESTSTILSLSSPILQPIRSDDTMENNINPVKQNMYVQVPPPIEPSLQELVDSSPESNEDSLTSFIFGTLKKENLPNVSPVGSEPIRFDSVTVSSEEKYESITFVDADSTRDDSYTYDVNVSQFTEASDQDVDQYLLKGNSATSSFREYISKELKGKQFNSDNFLSSSHHRYGENAKFPLKHENPEVEKLELKQMVLKFQNQLNQFQEDLMSVSLKTSHQGQAVSSKCQVSHIPNSAEITTSKQEMISILCRPTKCVNHSQCVNDCNQNCYNVHCSCSPNSCPCTNSDLSMKRDNMLANGNKKSNVIMRRVLPVKGGAPFVICDKCSKLLQLPAGFVLFRKKFHLVKCGSCSYALKFSLRNGCTYTS